MPTLFYPLAAIGLLLLIYIIYESHKAFETLIYKQRKSDNVDGHRIVYDQSNKLQNFYTLVTQQTEKQNELLDEQIKLRDELLRLKNIAQPTAAIQNLMFTYYAKQYFATILPQTKILPPNKNQKNPLALLLIVSLMRQNIISNRLHDKYFIDLYQDEELEEKLKVVDINYRQVNILQNNSIVLKKHNYN